MPLGLWDLGDHAARLDDASLAWGDLGSALTAAGDGVDSGSRQVRAAGWEGRTADSWDAHRKQLTGSLDEASTLAGRMASTLSRSAGSVRIAQGHLDQSWATVAGVPYTTNGPVGSLLFQPRDDAERTLVSRAITAADQTRAGLDRDLATDTAALRTATTAWRVIADQWLAVAEGYVDPFTVPDEGAKTGVITVGDQTIVDTGNGDDTVKVFTDPRTGEEIVVVNGTVYRLPAGQHVTVRTGAGNDTVEVPAGTGIDLTILGSSGDDKITGGSGSDTILGLDGHDSIDAGGGDDRVSGGAGRDYLDGQSGDDVVTGGTGDDTLYGLDGRDTLDGGEGQDYEEGGTGDDLLVGGEGNDIQSGGDGDDTILGGAGDDVAYGGHGTDTVTGGAGHDTAYLQPGDVSDVDHRVTVQIPDDTQWITIEGSPDFVAHTRADLAMFESSPTGQQMLANLRHHYDDSGFLGLGKASLTIREYYGANSKAIPGVFGNEIQINPHLDSLYIPGGSVDGPPSVVFYHELGHVYDYVNDTSAGGTYDGVDVADHGMPNSEREAAGLPIDSDGDPSTPERIDPDHPYVYTENGLRDEMGAPHRDHY